MEIKYNKFNFYEPPYPNKEGFIELKKNIFNSPRLELGPENDFISKYGIEFILSIVCLLFGIIGFSVSHETFKTVTLIIAALIFLPLVISGRLNTMQSYFWFNLKRSFYYNRLKRSIVKAEKYEDFIKLMKKSSFMEDFSGIFQ
ncbi:hypothetical protein Belba_0351 [Belliella baltica DSM 15883]|uniref:Uncharacterized protein n=1 Tax=Belliella baltica (strain DSM 15883 / CIP 108006 / LMG 21964 / BA134) TaxID=866536 RepID=I3Z196_BELBD|nr:hypothetical protein [Belliella baltica]AFL83014.1 hypothetical protein Belba_0351 [Belliella baltica DSM 15883]